VGKKKKRKAKAQEACCDKYRQKGKACGDCPLMAGLSKKKRKKLLAQYVG
jgi:hypothetical protein